MKLKEEGLRQRPIFKTKRHGEAEGYRDEASEREREREREGETETQKDSKALTRRVGGGSPRQEEKAVGRGE